MRLVCPGLMEYRLCIDVLRERRPLPDEKVDTRETQIMSRRVH